MKVFDAKGWLHKHNGNLQLTRGLPVQLKIDMKNIYLCTIPPAKVEVIEGNAVSGVLAMEAPWPGQMRTVYGDHKRFEETYFDQYKGY